MAKLPDLRADTDFISLDHCYVLIEHIGRMFDIIEGADPGCYAQLAEEIDPTLMQDTLQAHFEPAAFSRLYKTEMGKGILVGIFAKGILEHDEAEDEGEAHD